MTALQGAQTPPGLERPEAPPRLAEDVVENRPEYLSLFQDPSPCAAAGGVCLAGALAGARTGARRLAEKPGDIVLGRGREGRLDRLFGNPVVAGWIDRTHHVELVGPTGSGKTTTLLPRVVQDFVCGHTVVEEIYGDFGTSLIPYATALGRPLFVLDPPLPGSLCWNPLAGEVVGHFASVVKGLFAPGLGADDVLGAPRSLGFEKEEVHDERVTNPASSTGATTPARAGRAPGGPGGWTRASSGSGGSATGSCCRSATRSSASRSGCAWGASRPPARSWGRRSPAAGAGPGRRRRCGDRGPRGADPQETRPPTE